MRCWNKSVRLGVHSPIVQKLTFLLSAVWYLEQKTTEMNRTLMKY